MVFLFVYDELICKTSLFFLDKIEEAQKELNGAEVSKKGKLHSATIYILIYVFLTVILL